MFVGACRLQPPKREDAAAKASFKPGAATWNTDDPKQAPPGQRPEDRKKKPSAAAAAAEKAAAEKKAGEKQAPQPYLTDAKYTTDEFRTSGMPSSRAPESCNCSRVGSLPIHLCALDTYFGTPCKSHRVQGQTDVSLAYRCSKRCFTMTAAQS